MSVLSFLDREHSVAKPGYSRWLVPPAALAIHLSIGQAYALSVFKIPMTTLLGITAPAPVDWKQGTIAHLFQVAIAFLGISAAVFGAWLDRVANEPGAQSICDALLVAVPILGIIVQLKRGNALPLFGAWNFASPWPTDRATARSVLEVHGLLANALLILAGFHGAAALVHHYVFRDRTLVRMLPGST